MKRLVKISERVISGIAVLSAILMISFSCTKDDNKGNTTTTGSGNPGANEVFMQGSAFNPTSITIMAGTKVTWTNKDGMTHTVTSDTNLFDSGNIAGNGTYSYTFTTAGTYPYHCKIHSGMKGTVVVQ